MSIISLKNINYKYPEATKKTLDNISHSFSKGKFYAIVGQSGAGKSTLLSLLAGLEEPTNGAILFNGYDIKLNGYSYHRKNNISLVFQNYNLIDYLTPLENLKLVDKKATDETLLKMELKKEHMNKNVLKLSGGQAQRVAIARAISSKAPVILADEPTGNLDSKTATDIIELLKDIAHKENKCVIIVTHSKKLEQAADIVLELHNGKLIEK